VPGALRTDVPSTRAFIPSTLWLVAKGAKNIGFDLTEGAPARFFAIVGCAMVI